MMARSLLQFLLIGAVLFGARYAIGHRSNAPPPPRVVVSVSREATAVEVARAVDEALLFDLAMRSGWVGSDPLVRDRLARNLRFADDAREGDGASPEAKLVQRALDLGMHRTDAVVRQRLIGRARAALAAAPAAMPNDAELGEHARANSARFARPSAASFTHIFLSAERRGSSLGADAGAMAERLADAPPAPGQAPHLSDPLLLPSNLRSTDMRRIDASFGPGFAQHVMAAPLRRWTGPVRSSYGLHFLWVAERGKDRLPPLAEIRQRVASDLKRERHRARLREALDRLRASYDIRIERLP